MPSWRHWSYKNDGFILSQSKWGETCSHIRSAGQCRSISSMIRAAQRTASAMALIVAGTLAPLSYWESFLAAMFDALHAADSGSQVRTQ